MKTEQLYNDHVKLIHNVANSHSRTSGIDSSDLVSLGNEVFMRCVAKWNPEKAKFSTLLQHALTRAYNSEARKIKRRRELDNEAAVVMVTEGHNDTGLDWLLDFMEGVTNDAQQVVALLLDGDLSVRDGIETRRGIKAAIRTALTLKPRGTPPGARWSSKRVSTAYAEIGAALKA